MVLSFASHLFDLFGLYSPLQLIYSGAIESIFRKVNHSRVLLT
jgi:hypothetical protein